MAFAAVTDVEARWRELTVAEKSRAAVLLEDAAAMLTALVAFDTTDATYAEPLKVVSCNMVIRAMSASESDLYGVSQTSMTAGSYSQSWSYSNPSGDMYLTKLDKRLLGITTGYVRTIRPKIGCSDD